MTAAPLGAAAAQSAPSDTAKLRENERFLARLLGRDKLLWSPNVQPEGYKSLERILATRRIGKSQRPTSFHRGETPAIAYDDGGRRETLDDFMRLEHIAGIAVVQQGVLRLEKYGLGLKPTEHWTSMSMVKSLTSTLVGCALHDRILTNLDATAERFVPVLKGSAYDGVTIRQLLTMTSGVRWNENYMDPTADVNLFYEKVIADREAGGILAHLRTLPREAAPGSRFHYNTGDTFVIGCILRAALRGSVADYCAKRIWGPMGAAQDGFFLLESDGGQEVCGSSASASLLDYARFGEFILAGGVSAGQRSFGEGWVGEATKPAAPGVDRGGYGYQWWLNPDGAFEARGFAGQLLHIDPARRITIVLLSALPAPHFRAAGEASPTRRANFLAAAKKALT